MLAKNADSAVRGMADAVADTARVTVPVDTGALRASIHVVAWRRGGITLYSGYEAASRASVAKAAYGGRKIHQILAPMPVPPRWTAWVAAPTAYAEYVEYVHRRYFMHRAVVQSEGAVAAAAALALKGGA